MQRENKKDCFTPRERDCRSRISEVLWITNFGRRGNRDDNFYPGGTEKEEIIKARYWGLEIPASEVCGDTIS